MRATLLYDTVAAQLDDKINVFSEFDKYAHAAVKRQRRRMKKDLARQAIGGPEDWVWQRYNQVEKIAGRVLFIAEKLVNEPNLRIDASFNIVVGIVGAILGGLIFPKLFNFGGSITSGDFSLPSLLVSLLGAIILLAIVNLVRRGSVR